MVNKSELCCCVGELMIEMLGEQRRTVRYFIRYWKTKLGPMTFYLRDLNIEISAFPPKNNKIPFSSKHCHDTAHVCSTYSLCSEGQVKVIE